MREPTATHNAVFKYLNLGRTDEQICRLLGLNMSDLLRFKKEIIAFNAPAIAKKGSPAGPSADAFQDIVLEMIKRQSITIAELCEELKTDRNKIRLALRKLSSKGFIFSQKINGENEWSAL